MKSTFLRRIAAVLTIVVALAQFAPVEAAKRNKRKRHRNHHSKELLGAADIQRKAAQYAHELLLDLPAGALGSVSITEGTDFQTAVRKNVRGLKAAIANSSWPQAAKNAAFWNLPPQLIGGGGSGNWSGETSNGGYCFCWTRTTIFFKDPWYVIRFTVKICCTPAATPTSTPTATPTPTSTPTPTPTATATPTATPTSTPTATPTPTCTPGAQCVYTRDEWTAIPNWPVQELQLGNVIYDRGELQFIMDESIGNNGLIAVAQEEIAAKLNIANGAHFDCIAETVTDVDVLIGNLVIPPIGSGFIPLGNVQGYVNQLAQYNKGD